MFWRKSKPVKEEPFIPCPLYISDRVNEIHKERFRLEYSETRTSTPVPETPIPGVEESIRQEAMSSYQRLLKVRIRLLKSG